MNCFTKVQQAALTSITVMSLFYLVDLLFLKYWPGPGTYDRRARYQVVALEETAVAKDANDPMPRLENPEASLREIVASHREGALHTDSSLQYYEYKLGLEQDYWDNKMTVGIMIERLRRLNDMHVEQSDPELIRILKEFWIHPPSVEPYELESSTLVDFSMGQSAVVDKLLKNKVYLACIVLHTRTDVAFRLLTK